MHTDRMRLHTKCIRTHKCVESVKTACPCLFPSSESARLPDWRFSEGSRWKSDDFRRATEAPLRPSDSGKTVGVGMAVGDDAERQFPKRPESVIVFHPVPYGRRRGRPHGAGGPPSANADDIIRRPTGHSPPLPTPTPGSSIAYRQSASPYPAL